VALSAGDCSPEGVAANWERISDRNGESVPKAGAEQAMRILQTMQQSR
jgi:hypothetical protein